MGESKWLFGKIFVHMDTSERELDILTYIAQDAHAVHQRDLARVVGLSLGMTNAIVKRLAQKGWLTIRKVNNRNIRYAVSPTGIEQIARRSYRYFRRTIKNIVFYREAIENLVRHVKEHGYRGLALKGRSDLDFIVEHACRSYGIEYIGSDQKWDAANSGTGELFTLYSESHIPDARAKGTQRPIAFLQEVVNGGVEIGTAQAEWTDG